MIEFVKTPHGLMPQSIAAKIEKQKADRLAARKDARFAVMERRAHRFGLPIAEVMAMAKDGLALLEKAAGKARDRFTKHDIERAYPCRTCRLVTDEKYEEACRALGLAPCYLKRAFRGCLDWKPRTIIAQAPDARRIR